MALANGTGEILPSSKTAFRPSESQARAKTRLRQWKRHRQRWSKEATFSGKRYRSLVADGRARPFQLHATLVRDLHVLAGVSRRALDLLGHVLACERAFGGHAGGVILGHATSAELLQCSERSAGTAMRELVELGLVEQRAWFVTLGIDEGPAGTLDAKELALVRMRGGRGKHKHREVTPRYVTTKRCRALVGHYAAKNQAGKNCQPGRIQPPLRGDKKEPPCAGRPGELFAAELAWTRQDASAKARLAPRAKARVIARLADGSVMLGSPLRGTTDPEALQKARSASHRASPATVEFDDSPERAFAWAAFEAREAARASS